MTSSLDSGSESAGDRARARAYSWDYLPGIGAFAVVIAVVTSSGGLRGESPWRFLWALLPVLPAVWVVRAVVRHLHRIDEFQRLLTLQALSVGFLVAMVVAVTGGFLGIAGLEPPFPLATGCWVVYGAG